MIRVFLADDHALVLEGLRSLIESEDDITVVGTAPDGDQVLDAVRAERLGAEHLCHAARVDACQQRILSERYWLRGHAEAP